MAEKKKKLKEKKKQKKAVQRGPKYCESLLKTKVLNYSEYYLSAKEKTLFSVGIFIISTVVALIMYGGIAGDENGSPTLTTYFLDAVICLAAGIISVKLVIPVIQEKLKRNRQKVIRQQFMDMLDSLSGSVASGNNAAKAFETSRNDLAMQYGEDSYIVQEVTLLLQGQQNFVSLDALLSDFGKRSGIAEIENFAQVFAVSYRKGGDFGRVIRDTYDILYNKIAIEQEIQTKIAATKNEFNIILVMPVAIMLMMKLSGGDFARNLGTPAGIAGVTVGILLIVAAIFIAGKITDIGV